MSPVLLIVGKTSHPVDATQAGEPHAHLWVERLEPVGLAIEDYCRVQKLIVVDQFQFMQNGWEIAADSGFKASQGFGSLLPT